MMELVIDENVKSIIFCRAECEEDFNIDIFDNENNFNFCEEGEENED